MEIIALVVSVLNLITSFLVYRKVLGSKQKSVYPEPVMTEPASSETVPEEPLHKELVSVSTAATDERYQAWRNQTGIAWAPAVSPPEAPIKPVHRGPLERPGGFV